MHIDAIGAFLIAIVNTVFWTLIFMGGSFTPLARSYFGWACFITVWSFGYGVTLSGAFSYEATLIWNRFCQAMATMIGPFFFKFSADVAGKFDNKNKQIFKIYLFLGITNATALFFTPLYVKGLWSFGPYRYQPLGGPLYGLFVVFFIWCTLHSYIVVALQYKKAVGLRKTHMTLFLLATGIAYFGGVTLLFQGFKLPIPTTGVYLILAYVVLIGYSIHRYKFLDVEVILKKTLVFAGLITFVFGVFTTSTFLVTEVLHRYFELNNSWINVISIFVIVLAYDPLRNLLVDMTDKFLFQKKYDYQKLLRDASKGISKIESLDHLLSLVVHFITMRMRVENSGVLTRSSTEHVFKLGYQRGYKKNYLEYKVEENHPFIEYLTLEKDAIDIEQIKELIENKGRQSGKNTSSSSYDYTAIKQKMEELEAHCCIPSFLGKELRNILILGPKKSGDIYTEEDHNVLYTLAQESAIAIENARLYDEAINKSRELERINKQLEHAKSSLTVALEETEAANKQLQDTQAQLIHEQKMATLGRLAASVGHEVNNPLTILSMNISRAILKFRKNADLKVGEILDIFKKMEQNISRIKAVVNTLTGLLKKSEKGKFEPLSLKLILEETLPLVQFQTYLDNLAGTEVEFNVPGNVPLIRGDLERLQEVFLNLFINAYHAMEGRRNPKIIVQADFARDANMVEISFTDNGKGMSEETRKKIFNYGYTTKPPGRGSGLGLYMCKYIIELHGGDIQVTSVEGRGTTFKLTIPAYEEPSTNLIGGQEIRTGS
ncbi:MAG: hypothetical protein H6757_06660 [Candidatus Omnitrophica bacterium]|nr:hypothetical protein [Candidatus Omnitrophota bacterium]